MKTMNIYRKSVQSTLSHLIMTSVPCAMFNHFLVEHGDFSTIYIEYSMSPGFWQSFVTIGVHKDHIPALARFCKKQLTGFFVRLLFFVKCKHYH